MDVKTTTELEAENAALRARLAAAEARAMGLVAQSMFSVQLLEPGGRTRYVNPAWERLWGMDLSALEAMGYNMLEDPQLEAQGIAPYIRRGFAGEACAIPVISYDPAQVGLPGTLRYVAGYIYPVKDAQGAITEVVVMHQDVTDRVLAEQSLADTNQRLQAINRDIEQEVRGRTQELHEEQSFIRAMLETLGEGIVTCDADGMLTLFNQAAREMHGETERLVPLSEWMNAYPLFKPDGVTPFTLEEVPLFRALQGEVVRDVEMLLDPANRRRHVVASGQAIYDEHGRKLGAVLALHDITDRKRDEAELAARSHALEEANAQLREADKYKDEFLSVISHELRTPLNFIMGFASILEDEVEGPLNDRQHHHLRRILNGSDRMLLLVNDLLDFAKLHSGKFELSAQPTPYAALVEEAIALMHPLAAPKGIAPSMALSLEGHVPVIDGPRVTQVLTNLLSNAVKFTEPDGRVFVRAYVKGDRLVTEVTDTGVGIAPEDIARLFKRFQQLEMGNARRASGTGLGLAISKALIEAHGGEIGVDSTPGVGSTFWFSLPLAP